MPVVQMTLNSPANGSRFQGAAAVPLRATITSAGAPALFTKWYSSLVPPAGAAHDASIPVPGGANPLDFSFALPSGSQILTVSTKDVLGDLKTDLAAVRYAGAAGGPPAPGNAGCLVHVYRAELMAPSAGATLHVANATLSAKAPWSWAQSTYQSINDLRYHWYFAPVGSPAGRPSADFVTAPAQLTFATDQVTYQGALPSGLGSGAYQLTLRVESITTPAIGDQTTIAITLAP